MLQPLREWSHEQVTQIFPRGPREGRAHGAGAPRGISIAVGGSGVAGTEDRLRSAHAVRMDAQGWAGYTWPLSSMCLPVASWAGE